VLVRPTAMFAKKPVIRLNRFRSLSLPGTGIHLPIVKKEFFVKGEAPLNIFAF
jgi:hypothetical protein